LIIFPIIDIKELVVVMIYFIHDPNKSNLNVNNGRRR